MPAAVTPQVSATPPVTAAKLTPAGACTSTGLDWLVVVPSPSWPLPLPPQQYAVAPAAPPDAQVAAPAPETPPTAPRGARRTRAEQVGLRVGRSPARPP